LTSEDLFKAGDVLGGSDLLYYAAEAAATELADNRQTGR